MSEQPTKPELIQGSKGKIYDPAETVGETCFTGARAPLSETVKVELPEAQREDGEEVIRGEN